MSMVEKARNTLLPPPAAVIGLMLLLIWVLPIGVPNGETIAQTTPEPITSEAAADAWEIGLPATSHEAVDLRSISDNSLFLQRRTPWQDAPETIVAEPEPIETIVPEPPVAEPRAPLAQPMISLLGIVSTENVSRALIFDEAVQSERWVTSGDLIGEWQVVQIGSDDIILRAQGEEIVVTYNR